MSGQFTTERQPMPSSKSSTQTKKRGRVGSWHNPLPLALPSVRQEAESIPSNDTALRADDLHLLVADRPRSPVNGELLPGGGSHARPCRTQVVRSLGGDSNLLLLIRLNAEIDGMIATDNLASPNRTAKRRNVIHSAGKDVQRHVISESVAGTITPMRQVADASAASYETIDATELGETYLANNGVVHARPITLSDLRLELGISVGIARKPFAVQMESAFHALEFAAAVERIEQAVIAIQVAIAAPQQPGVRVAIQCPLTDCWLTAYRNGGHDSPIAVFHDGKHESAWTKAVKSL